MPHAGLVGDHGTTGGRRPGGLALWHARASRPLAVGHQHASKVSTGLHQQQLLEAVPQGSTAQARPASSMRSILRSTASASSSWQMWVTVGRMRP